MLNAEDEMLQQALRRFALNSLAPDYERWKKEPFPRHRVRDLGQLGVLGMRVPPEHGGSGGTFTSLGVAAEELSRGDLNVSYFLQLQAIGAELLSRADDRLKADWWPRVATGDALLAFGLTEPDVGSDAASLTSSARRDGRDWVINGEKSSITFAGLADACVVFARTCGPGARGITTILVPLNTPGVSRHVYSSAGAHLSQRGSLFFDDVRVPLDHQLGAEGTGFVDAMRAFDFNRAVIALACIGCAQQSLDETIEHTKQRSTFGKPLARHEAVAFTVAEHTALLHATRLVAYEALALADSGQPHTKQAAMAKWLGPKQAADAIHACLLLHGWPGYGTDLPLQQRLLDVVGLEIGDGTAEMMKAVISREVYGRAYSAHK